MASVASEPKRISSAFKHNRIWGSAGNRRSGRHRIHDSQPWYQPDCEILVAKLTWNVDTHPHLPITDREHRRPPKSTYWANISETRKPQRTRIDENGYRSLRRDSPPRGWLAPGSLL